MSLTHLRARSRLLICALIGIAVIASISFEARRQQAAGPLSRDASNLPADSLAFSSDGGITPAASTITVNSNADAVSGADGLCFESG